MKHIIKTMGATYVAIALLWLGGCASTLEFAAKTFDVQIVPEKVKEQAYKAASVSFTAWGGPKCEVAIEECPTAGLQAAIEKFGNLPPCVSGGPLLCRPAGAWPKVKEIERTTSATLNAARPLIAAGSDDVDFLMSLPAVVFDAEQAFNNAKKEP